MSVFNKYKELISTKDIDISKLLGLSDKGDLAVIMNILFYYKDDILNNKESFDVYVKYLTVLTSNNIYEAYVDLGNAYRFSTRYYSDANDKALEYYGIAAINGFPEVYINMGHIYMVIRCNFIQEGNKITIPLKDDLLLLSKELECYKNAESHGVLIAYYELAEFYNKTGEYNKAKEYYEKSLKCKEMFAISGLSSCISNLNKVDNVALTNLKIDNKDVESIMLLATAYKYGLGVEENIEEAINLYNLALSKKSSEAMVRLFKIYSVKGRDTYDFEKSFDLALKLSDLDYSIGQHFLGNYYKNIFEFEKAIKYYNLAVKNRCSQSAFDLSELYKIGLGVDKDFKQYIKYYNLHITYSNE